MMTRRLGDRRYMMHEHVEQIPWVRGFQEGDVPMIFE